MEKPRFPTLGVALASVFLVAQPVMAQSDTSSAREQELAELVRTLSQRVEQLEQRLSELEQTKADRTTETRVQELEASVEQIKEERPPAADSEEWALMRKWLTDKSTLRPYWKDGLRLDSADGAFKLKIGGRIQNDWAYYCTDGKNVGKADANDFDEGVEFRRARLYVSGSIYDDIEFKAQYDFAGGDSDFKDVYLGFTKVPYVGGIRIGHFKEPFSLEELTSSKYITFMERGLPNVFAPSRNTGVMLHNAFLDDRMTWAAGVFRQTDDFGDGVGGRDYNVTARLTGLPWYEEDGKRLLHLGAGYTHQNYEDDVIRFRERPESHLAPRVVDTGEFPAEYGDLLGAELAWVHGPFSLQGEYVHAFMQGAGRFIGDPDFWGAYLQASYFLTGEHRPYKTANGTFGNVKPLRNFGKDGGAGAWEVAARYSYLTLNDAGVDGGRLRDFTLGLNWYLNPNLRIMWNYLFADPSEGSEVDIFQMRLQLAF
jgi:phosphate-selective porin OprO/OprP